MAYDGDIMLYPTEDGGDINIVDGQPDMDAGLWTYVYLALFTGEWWGNAISDEQGKFRKSIEDLMESDSNQNRMDVQEAARGNLKSMIDEGIATAVDAVATIPATGRIDLTVTVTEPAADPTVLKYKINWAGQRAAMGVS